MRSLFGTDVEEGDQIDILFNGQVYRKTVVRTYSFNFVGERIVEFTDGTNLHPTDGAVYMVRGRNFPLGV